MEDIKTVKDLEMALMMFGIDPMNVTVYDQGFARPGRAVIVVHKQRFKAWWHRRKIKEFIKNRISVGVLIHVAIEL